MAKSKLPSKINASLNRWEKQINQALTKNTGPFSGDKWVGDLHDYLTVIKLCRKDRVKGGLSMQDMETSPREEIPDDLYNYFAFGED